MTNRLFITLDIPDESIEEISSLARKIYGDNPARWEGKNKLHITLKFLGDTDIELIDDIQNELESIAKKHKKIAAGFDRFGMFYKNNSPKIFWIGIAENESLKKLQKEVDDKISNLGFEKENRKYHPHLTLLRIKGKENFASLKKMKDTKIDPIKFTARKISLMKSELNQTGSVYTTIKSFELS